MMGTTRLYNRIFQRPATDTTSLSGRFRDVLSKNPLLRGAITHFLRTSFQELGLDIANLQGCVVFTAHTYTAYKFESQELSEWEGLQQILDANPGGRGESLLLPDRRETDRSRYFRRFTLCAGVNASTMFSLDTLFKAINQSATLTPKGDAGIRKIKFPGTLSQNAKIRMEASSSGGYSQPLLHSGRGVDDLGRLLSAELKHLDIPYFEVSILSWKILRMIDAKFARKASEWPTKEGVDSARDIAIWAMAGGLEEKEMTSEVAKEIQKILSKIGSK
jgi:hypothetical protein